MSSAIAVVCAAVFVITLISPGVYWSLGALRGTVLFSSGTFATAYFITGSGWTAFVWVVGVFFALMVLGGVAAACMRRRAIRAQDERNRETTARFSEGFVTHHEIPATPENLERVGRLFAEHLASPTGCLGEEAALYGYEKICSRARELWPDSFETEALEEVE